MANDPEDEDRQLQEQFNRLSTEQKRNLFRQDASRKRFATRMQDHLAAYAEDPWATGNGGDNAIQVLIQRELFTFCDLLIDMKAPRPLVTAILRLLIAFQARRDNTYDSLLASAGSNKPHWVVQEFRAHVVAAVVELYDAGTDLQSALAAVCEEVAGVYHEEGLGPLLGEPPTTGSISGWYEDRGTDTRLGQFYVGLRDHVPPNLTPKERVTWLLKNGAVRCRYVGPVARKGPVIREKRPPRRLRRGKVI